MQKDREGKLTLKFFDREIQAEWIKDIKGKKVLCLAGAGGLQAVGKYNRITFIDKSN